MIITIFVSDESKIEKIFEKIRYSRAIEISKMRNQIDIYMEYDEIRIVVIRDNVRGMRHNYVFIDKDIDNELVELIIMPKIMPITTIFGSVHLEQYCEYIDVENWNGRINRE